MKNSTVNPQILSFFRDPDASSVLTLSGQQITAPTVRGQDLTDEEIGMGGGVRLVMHVFDRSPSMEPVTDLMLGDFNAEYVSAVKEARQDDITALRLAGVSFSSDITPIWQKGGVSFYKLDELPALTKQEYNPQRGNGTALHQAIIDAYHIALEYAAQIQRESGIQPEIDIVVLSDGYNNCPPNDKDEVKTLIDGSKPELVRWIYFYFETEPGACKSTDARVNPEKIARALGFDKENIMLFAQIDNEDPKDRRKRFRRMLRIMSKVSGSKGMSAVKAAATEEEIV